LKEAEKIIFSQSKNSIIEKIKSNVKNIFYVNNFSEESDFFSFKEYLDILKPGERKLFTRLRIGAHKLYVESGRWKKLSRDERICRFCESGNVEDEDHILWSCQNFQMERQSMYDQCRMKTGMDEESLKKHFMYDKECAPFISCFLMSIGKIIKKSHDMYVF